MKDYNPIRDAAEAHDAAAIAKCRQDPRLIAEEAAGDLCIPCMMDHPCICDKNATLRKMRAWYEANKALSVCSFFGRLVQTRAEPVLHLNWGQKGDGLMDGLYKIAREPYELEIGRLRRKIRELEKAAP